MAEDRVEFDVLLEQCCDPHRRVVLAVLADQQRTVTLRDLTKAVVTHNHHQTPSSVPGETMKQVHTLLYHHHVPMLAAAELVRYDPERRQVEPTEQFERLRELFSTIVDADPSLERPVEL